MAHLMFFQKKDKYLKLHKKYYITLTLLLTEICLKYALGLTIPKYIIVFGRFFTPSMILYPFLAILYVFSTYYFPNWSDTIKRLNVLAGLVFAYNLAVWLLKKEICRIHPFLPSASFFLYITHALISSRIPKALFTVMHPTSDFAFLCMYLLATALTVLLPLGAFYLLRRYCPGLLRVVAGRN